MRESKGLKEYLTSQSTEDAKRPLIYPYLKKMFPKEFKVESDAENADGYVEGKLLVELKTRSEDWLKGLYQALHYRKRGLTYPNILVICKQFIGLWKLNDLPEECLHLADSSDSQISPSKIGVTNANKTSRSLSTKILLSHTYLLSKVDFDGLFVKDIDVEISALTNALKNLDRARIQINLRNFIDSISLMEKFFPRPLDAIHAFYAIVGYWGDTSKVNRVGERQEAQVNDPSRAVNSEPIPINNRCFEGFKRFVETHYIFTNEGSGITYDNYFSKFDEVIARLDPDYAKQHGIFFTDHNLSKFAMWFVHERFEKHLSDNYIVFDPAGGSGNLITSLDWRGHMKHKIVSELQPDLLKVIERRMRVHERHIGKYTIIPKTIDNRGLNFLDKSGSEYVSQLENVLNEKGLNLDKPIAFLMNPPYKNTDENVAAREQVEAEYTIDESILELTGNDAGKERYLAFLGQIVNIAKSQNEKYGFNPILMIFTPTSWLIPRPTYVGFREKFDRHFQFVNGFIITSNEFFALKGKWPLAFTIWRYNNNKNGNKNRTKVLDLTSLKKNGLAEINWSGRIKEIDKSIKELIKSARIIPFDNSRKEIKSLLPKIMLTGGNRVSQPRYNIYRNLSRAEIDMPVVSGWPIGDDRHQRIAAPHGYVNGGFVGFMDDLTPVRVKIDKCKRLKNEPNRVWFRLDTVFIKINSVKILSGPADNRSFCAYDLDSAKATMVWYSIAKSCNGRYPIWANQFDIWKPKIQKSKDKYFYSLCFAFSLAENRCIVTKFEKNNPVVGAPEIYVDNPMSTNNLDSFWNTVLNNEIVESPPLASNLVEEIKGLYIYWAKNHCPSVLTNIGLQDEPYFKYFSYPDFLTPHSGLIQIRKYAEMNGKSDLLEYFERIGQKSKIVRDEIFRLLNEFKYFE